jgi:hypothetical protein
MKPPLPRTLSAVPKTLHTRLEIAKAIRALAGPDEDELLRQRRAEIAAIRRDLETLVSEIRKAGEECLALAKAELRTALKKYSPNQPRVPAGNSGGGQWTSDGGNGPADDSRVVSDVTPDNTWKPGAQYAQNTRRGGGGPILINGNWLDPTPAQAARLTVAEAQAQDALARVRNFDPYWQPTPGLYATIEGKISDLEAQAQEAKARLAELASAGIGPGPFAGNSIPARGPGRNFYAAERVENNENGDESGCHTCGTKDPGTPLDNYVLDHQPPTALNLFGSAQRLYPQCVACSRQQGGWISHYLRDRR